MGAKRKASAPALSGEALGRLRSVIESQRELGGASYPVTVRRLFELAGVEASAATLKATAGNAASRFFRITAKQNAARPEVFAGALAFLAEDVNSAAAAPAVLRLVLDGARTGQTDIFTPAELARKLPAFMQAAFKAAANRWAETAAAPPGLLIVRLKGHAYLHLLEGGADEQPRLHEHAHPPATPVNGNRPAAAGTAADGFARDFAREFERLDRASGNNNYVLLHDLRRALPDVDRTEFDARLKELRLARRFTLDSPDGRHVRLTPEQLDAGIREGSSTLVYVARRDA